MAVVLGKMLSVEIKKKGRGYIAYFITLSEVMLNALCTSNSICYILWSPLKSHAL